jgi:hypothetical protein
MTSRAGEVSAWQIVISEAANPKTRVSVYVDSDQL